MRIALCTPFKSIEHPRLSGDVTIARDLRDYFQSRGHDVFVVPQIDTKWIYWKPWLWPLSLRTAQRAIGELRENDVQALITYHSYYKAPDILGPLVKEQLRMPYFLFSGAYADKRRNRLKTRPGYHFNRRAMLSADHVFCNKRTDFMTCGRLLEPARYSYIKPGIPMGRFRRDEAARQAVRDEWRVMDNDVVVMTAAILRPGVKADGVAQVIRSCGELIREGLPVRLVVAGDGPERENLEILAGRKCGERVRFLGMVDRNRLPEVYSGGDLFAFPGYNEGLGMVYLEAQCCGLPAIATNHAGAPEVISNESSGLVVPAGNREAFSDAIRKLAKDHELRARLSHQAIRFVESEHSIDKNYRRVDGLMRDVLEGHIRRAP